MGCDIHAFIEYRSKMVKSSDDKWLRRWIPLSDRLHLPRDYDMFGHMAGVRSNVEPVVPPRGVPNDLGYAADDDWWIFISDDNRERARMWHEMYNAQYRISEQDGQPAWIENPDQHTPSWLTHAEFQQAITLASVRERVGVAYPAALAAMATLALCDQEVRLVFWFDN